MKILPYSPKNIAQPGSLDRSRLGFQVEEISLDAIDKKPCGVVIVGFADDTGIKNVGGRLGARQGPEAVRTKLYKFTSADFAFPLYDLGDLLPETSVEETHAFYAKTLERVHRAGHFPLVIGGGHDLAFPEALALLRTQEKKISFLNIDAHLDLRPITTGITSGSPWYLLLESGEFQKQGKRLVEFGIQRHCNAQSLLTYAAEKKVEIQWLSTILGKKPLAFFEKTLSRLGRSARVQVSLDIDSVAWKEAPGCSAPQTLGFSASDVIGFSKLSGKNSQVASFGIYELSPPLETDGQTVNLVAHCILSFLQGFATRKPLKKP